MRRRAPFICPSSQKPDQEASFHKILLQGPVRRDDGSNRWFLYRRQFVLPLRPDRAELDITADGRYQLFVNGHKIGRGPSRSAPSYQRVDHYDLSSHLIAGNNVIAVLVHVYGVDTAWYQQSRDYLQSIFGDGGLYVSAEIENGGEQLTIESDASWRWLESQAWRRDTTRSGWGQDFIEDVDARKMPSEWSAINFDDSDWLNACEMVLETATNDQARGWGPLQPFPLLLPREIPQLTETPVAPQSVLAIYSVKPRPDLPIDRRIFEEELEPEHEGIVQNPTALLTDDVCTTMIRTTATHDTAILLKFEQLHSGHPYVELDAIGGEIIELAVAETVPGEFLGEPEIPARLARRNSLDCAHVFRYTARPGKQYFEKFEWTAVRYMQLVVRNAPHGLKIRHVGSLYTHYPVENLGAFQCSDEMLNRLWHIGRYSALQCTHDAWEDCPGREKRQWLGDGIVHFLVGAAAFGPSTRAIDRQFLFHGMESQRPDGLLQMFAPGDHHYTGVIIPDFNLHWICAVQHYFMHYGDIDSIAALFPAIQKVLTWFSAQTSKNGLIADLPHWHFIEWANLGRNGESLTINAMFAGALGAAAKLAEALGYQRAANNYADQASRIAISLNNRHWDDARGVYVDSVEPISGKQYSRVSQQGNAAMIFWDIAPAVRWERIIDRITDTNRLKLTAAPPVVPVGQPIDLENDVVLANTFFSHFVFSALGKARRFDLALEQIQRVYEPMLATGTTTLWESFDPSASICHAFSATPVYQLSAHSLGVTPLMPAFEEILVAPQPGYLSSASGVYPTVLGEVGVSWKKDSFFFDLNVQIPKGARAKIVAPPGFKTEDQILEVEAGSHNFRFCVIEGSA